ncbi:MAG TPA: VWA domain-containing protein [Polyangia bacterium]|nr:VWA domain-containing protein [Polyangia bacterium]
MGRAWGNVGKGAGIAAVIALLGCGGGTAAPDGGAGGKGGSTGAAGQGGSSGAAGQGGSSGAAGQGGAAGSSVTISGAGGAGGATGGAAGSSSPSGAGGGAGAGAGGVSGVGGSAGSGGGTAGAGGIPGGGGIGGMNCRPDVLIVQDKSGSMSDDDRDLTCSGGCGANSKWAQVTTALTNVLAATDTKVNWGIKYFSDNGVCDASMAPAVPIAATNGSAVAASIAANMPGGNTPTRDAVLYATSYLQTLTDSNPKFLLLATDGLPNCPAGCAPMTKPPAACTTTDNPSEDAAAEAAVAMALSQGIKTFVVGIGNVTSAVNTLNQMAIDGGEAQTGGATSYYAATDESALEAALNSIVGKIAGCQ